MKALIAMSGGVDSAVAALRMLEQGYDCVGCTMRLYDNADLGRAESKTCCSLDDVEDAKAVARRLGIPHHTFNFSDDFREKVIGNFISEYAAGRTPNPCIECNRHLKFDRLHRRAAELGCDCVVTGHYARIERAGERWVLKKALVPEKDQSYVLYSLTQDQLARTRFPLGGLSKQEVRALAEAHGFINARKPDSQDICFVPDGDYAGFIERQTGSAPLPGPFLDADGNVLGQHRGLIHYTVGQRRGLGLSFGEPWYVLGLDPARNAVILGPKQGLFSRTLFVPDFHWISGETPAAPVRCAVKIRYRHAEQPATVYPEGNGVRVEFDELQRAITPGQSAVAYDGEVVLGGGIIA